MVTQVASELRELDDLLRGRMTDSRSLEKGVAHINVELFLKASVLLGLCYGMCMGLFAVLNQGLPGLHQMAATMIKVPLLFFFTVGVTYPSLYVFSALLGAKFGPAELLRILVTSVAINLLVLASLGPITGFFTITTTSYPFMKLLNVLFFVIAGAAGIEFLRRTLFLFQARKKKDVKMYGLPAANPVEEEDKEEKPEGTAVRDVFYVWSLAFF